MNKQTPITSFGKLMAEELTPEQIDTISGGGEQVTIEGQTGTCPIAIFPPNPPFTTETIIFFRDN